MPKEKLIDCPALRMRSDSYPFGNRVPRTVRMLRIVTADPMPATGFSYIKGDIPVAPVDEIFKVWTNSHGAVAAVLPNGTRLGLHPEEFEIETWHDLSTEATVGLVDFGFGDRTMKVTQEAYSIFLAREAAAREKIEALQERMNVADQRIDELESQLIESRKITLSGCEFSEDELIHRAVRAASGTHRRGTQRWIAMKDAFGCGSGVAHALCRRFGFDPDEMVKP